MAIWWLAGQVLLIAQPGWVPVIAKHKSQSFIGNDMVNGIACVIRRVVCIDNQRLQKEGVECGRAWYSPELHLTIKTESGEILPSGQGTKLIVEIYDIQIGVEPAATLFKIPAGFERVLRTPQLACPQCPRR